MGRRRKGRGGKKRKGSSKHSSIKDHKRSGKTLTPPLMAMPGMQLTSWLDHRLPEMIWAALLIEHLGRTAALELLRRIVRAADDADDIAILDPTISGLAKLEPTQFQTVMAPIGLSRDFEVAVRPLMLFGDNLPGRGQWRELIAAEADEEDWKRLARAVALCFDHQSQEATDCRWMRVICTVAAGRLHIPKQMFDEFVGYPDVGDQRQVRPSIRATEGTLGLVTGDGSTRWTEAFWSRAFDATDCIPLPFGRAAAASVVATVDEVREVTEKVRELHASKLSSTRSDARVDGAFGLSLYCLRLLAEIMQLGNAGAIVGRLALRSLVEAVITLEYLAKEDDPNTWQMYREYGAGQAKLAFLKLAETDDGGPAFIDREMLEALANEDRWLEYTSIDLGHWKGENLRRLAEHVGLKDLYDRYYDWTSAFTHANWAAVRNATLSFCGNPLHRLHRIPSRGFEALGDVVADAVNLTSRVLTLLSGLFYAPELAEWKAET